MYRVLVVDDDAPFVESLAGMPWDAQGCGLVGVAFNGEEALAKCEALLPDIIITDIAMPLMDGIALMEHVLRRHPNTQFILLTVHKSFDYALHAIQAGAVDYIVKDMHLRNNLPASLEKAVKRLSLLRGRSSPAAQSDILRLDAGTDPRLHLPVLAPLLARYAGTLATARLSPPMSDESGLEAFIRSACKAIAPQAGCVQWGNACFELLLPCEPDECREILCAVRRGAEKLLAPGQSLSVAFTPLEPAADAYPAAHEANASTLDLMFYQPRAHAVPAGAGRCAALSKALADAWIDAL
nr:response regulator [Clostridia bacterium]